MRLFLPRVRDGATGRRNGVRTSLSSRAGSHNVTLERHQVTLRGWLPSPRLPDEGLFGDETTYPTCQVEAARLRAAGAQRIEVRGAALLPGAARGWTADPALRPSSIARDGLVWVLFGGADLTAWIAAYGGSPTESAARSARRRTSSTDTWLTIGSAVAQI